MAKKKKEPTIFDTLPIDAWLAYIEETAKTEEEKRALKVQARRSLTVEKMVAYILKYDDTPEARKAFKKASFYIVKKDGEPLVNDKNEALEGQSVISAASYFVDKYIPDLKVEEIKKVGAFEAIKDW